MARFFAFFTLFHLSLTFFRPEVPFNAADHGKNQMKVRPLLVRHLLRNHLLRYDE